MSTVHKRQPTPPSAAVFGLTKQHALTRVLEVTHYTNRLFSFKVCRPIKFKFRAGEFVMVGLIIKGKPVFRAYSICSPSWKRELEFYSIKVPNGPLTSYLQKISTRNAVIFKAKATGTLLLKALKPGRRLFLLCTGTGFAPFASVLFDPEAYESFEEVIVVLTCRYAAELQYLKLKIAQLAQQPEVRAMVWGKARFYMATTRDTYPFTGRITRLIASGVLAADLGGEPLNADDRFMVCGSQAMIKDVTALLRALGYKEGDVSKPQSFVYEKAFVS